MRPKNDRTLPFGLTWSAAGLVAIAALAGACGRDDPRDTTAPPEDLGPRPVMPDLAAQTGAQRLTIAQYGNAVRDIFGESLSVPASLEPDAPADGFAALGASKSSISPHGVEQYEQAGFAIAKQITSDATLKSSVLVCAPSGAGDAGCATKVVTSLGRRVYRRPLAPAEVDRLKGIFMQASAALGSFDDGLEFAIAAMLQSPHFLYRPQVGEADPERPGKRRYTSVEMASRLSFFLWNSAPDDELLTAAEGGRLTDEQGLAEQVSRMLESPLARRGLRAFITEYLRLDELSALSKDPTIFTYYSPDVGPAAREETLRGFEFIVFDKDGDYRDIFITRRTFVDPKLASMYAVEAPTDEGFGEVELPESSPRIGLLGHISVLALHAHPTSSSATLRGKFIRHDLLCDEIPPPPVNVNTGLPEPTGELRTLRQRIAQHLVDPGCASCHSLMDPIGLGLENFDGIGRYRKSENDAAIDASGDLDGVPFADARELALAVHDSPKLGRCVVQKLYDYATAFKHSNEEAKTIDALTWDFRASGYRVKSLMAAIARSPGFRLAQDPK